MYALVGATVGLLGLAPSGHAQAGGPVFLSPHVANLPTATTLPVGGFQFEISHRFDRISGGSEDLWGIDGPVVNRIGLSWAPSSRVLLSLLRTNFADNLDVGAKARLASGGGSVPFAVAVKGGVALNTELPEIPGLEGNETQFYGQLVVNARFGDKLAVGVVPGVLANADIGAVDEVTTTNVGVYGQLYLTRRTSLLGEWVFTEETSDRPDDGGSFGVEMRVGGHFFKILVTNQVSLNPTQVLAGSASPFASDDLRFGFNITRRF